MLRFGRLVGCASVIAVLLTTIGCGDRDSRPPTAPSAVPSAAPAFAGLTPLPGGGQVLTRSADGSEVEGRATVSSLLGGGCPNLSFLVHGFGAPVRMTPATEFEDGSCAGVRPGRLLDIEGTLEADGSVTATEIKFQNGGDGGDGGGGGGGSPNDVQGSGMVATLVAGTVCPSLEFFVEGVRVRTNDATMYLPGTTCSRIIPGRRLEVHGVWQPDGSVLATRITLEEAPPGPPAPTPSPAPPPVPAPTPAPPVGVAYNQDIKPIVDADCTRCHSAMATYSGLLAFLTPGSASSRLVTVTQSGGSMRQYLSGDAAGKADQIRRWVVDFNAAENR